MMRTLWSAASGMLAQQSSIDITANNLANINTVGYKRVRPEFQDLFYATMRVPGALGVTDDQLHLPLQVGSGVRMTATRRDFSSGIFEETGRMTDFLIEGPGFFVIQTPQGLRYTRAGNFNLTPMPDGVSLGLFTTEVHPVLTADGAALGPQLIVSPEIEDIVVRFDGRIVGMRGGDPANDVDLGTLAIALFPNPSGLHGSGLTVFEESEASGAMLLHTSGEPLPAGQRTPRVLQSFLEASNVAAIDEFVRMIVAQRAYEMNSRAIQTADEMLQQANNLRR